MREPPANPFHKEGTRAEGKEGATEMGEQPSEGANGHLWIRGPKKCNEKELLREQ